jgi:two-component system sensor histidine kinase HydH
MSRQFLFKIAAPMILTSSLLLVLGVVAAWNIQRQQTSSSELIQKEVHGMIAAQELSNDVREIRHALHQYRHDGDWRHLDSIPARRQAATEHLAATRNLIRFSREADTVLAIDEAWQQFSTHYDTFTSSHDAASDLNQSTVAGSDARPSDVRSASTNPLLTDIQRVLDPAERFLTLDRILVDKTSEANRQTTEVIRQTVLWLGICGGLAGLIGGMMMARRIGQSVVQLDVSVRGAADRLQDVVGPVTISQRNGFRELEAGLQQVESQIATVVERLQQRELEVLRSDQLAAVGQLAAGVAHELRNPLMPMKMLVQAAVERDDGIGLCGRPLMVVEEEIRRMEKSIQDFLDFARPPTLEMTRFDLRVAIEQTVELVSRRAEEQQVEIIELFPDEVLMIEADAAQIRQVMLNLLLNSIEALRAGGRIEIEVTFGEKLSPAGMPARLPTGLFDQSASEPVGSGCRQRVINETSASSIGAFHIVLRDNGPGLSAAMLGRVFEPFVSTKETGTGLGLSICRRIVEAHGGMITASNLRGSGAAFSIDLPISRPAFASGDRSIHGEAGMKSN